MHIALWNSYYNPENDWWKNQKVDNWNHDADFHIDLIRKMDDWSVVEFSKENWESIIVMNNWIYDETNLPLLNNYQMKLNEKIPNILGIFFVLYFLTILHKIRQNFLTNVKNYGIK